MCFQLWGFMWASRPLRSCSEPTASLSVNTEEKRTWRWEESRRPITGSRFSFQSITITYCRFQPITGSYFCAQRFTGSFFSFQPITGSHFSFQPITITYCSFQPITASYFCFQPITGSYFCSQRITGSYFSFQPITGFHFSFQPITGFYFSPRGQSQTVNEELKIKAETHSVFAFQGKGKEMTYWLTGVTGQKYNLPTPPTA